MEDQILSDFKGKQQDLLLAIRTIGPRINSHNAELSQKCNCFLDYQRQQLKFLDEKRKIHMLERGKVIFRLVAEEQVTLAYLKEIYEVFAKPLNDFIQLMTKLTKGNNPALDFAHKCKQQALDIARDMLEISLVLETQPDNTNYDKKDNRIPTLLCLGAQILSDFSCKPEECHLVGVMESDLFKAANDNRSLDTVKGFKGFTVKAETSKQTKNSKSGTANQRQDTIKLGSWSIPKDQLSASEKGNAHKDWIRLKYNVRVKFHDTVQDLWLLSLPFNIRKGSIQMYTFTGALMWYYYNTKDPYKEFSIPLRLPISTVLDMLVTRLEVIGRKLSVVAKDFFAKRLDKLSSNGKVELETVTKGPPSTKTHQQLEIDADQDITRTVDEAVHLYGFFTWFYALAISLDVNGYMHELWLKGYIYDICEHEFMENMVKEQTFGFQTAVLRPSSSQIDNYQGKDINTGIAFYFKSFHQNDRVFTVKILPEDVKDFGLAKNLTYKMPNKFIWMSSGYSQSIEQEDLTSQEEVKQYHRTLVKKGGGPELVNFEKLSICNCQCHNADLDALPDMNSLSKKSRNFSGNSEGTSSTVSEGVTENLYHKKGSGVHNTGSPAESQMSSPWNTTLSGQWESRWDGRSQGSPDSGINSHMSPNENRIPDFAFILQGDTNANMDTKPSNVTVPLPSKREQLLANLKTAVDLVSLKCDDNTIEQLTNDIINKCGLNSNQLMPSLSGSLDTNRNTAMFNENQMDNPLVSCNSQLITDLNTGGMQVMQTQGNNDCGHLNTLFSRANGTNPSFNTVISNTDNHPTDINGRNTMNDSFSAPMQCQDSQDLEPSLLQIYDLDSQILDMWSMQNESQ